MPAPSANIFREYDIRGVYGRDLTPDVAVLLGRAFVFAVRRAAAKERVRLTVGADVRLSSPDLKAGLVAGMLEAGADVVDLGPCPTPLQYFSLHRLEADGGVMITGSHNPPEYNGFKMSIGRQTIFGDGIQDIRKIIETGAARPAAEAGRLETFDVISDYIWYLAGRFNSLAGLRVVVDSGNGTGGLVAPELLKRLGAEVIELYSEPDGRFPNHHPDPVVLENIRDLRDAVLTHRAHAGIGYDGDSDRLGVVDEHGEPVWGDMLMVVFSRDVLRHHPGAAVIGEVKCSQRLYDDIARSGGRPIMWKTGHSLIKKKMKEESAVLAGEMSGHIFFADRYFGFDDAIYASLRLLEIIKKSGEPYGVRKLLRGIPESVSTPEIRFDCPDEKKFGVVKAMQDAFRDYPNSMIDGIRISFPDGWALVRASNTQPALVLRFEAVDQGSLQKIEGLVRGRLNEIVSAGD
ncbi:MAG: phosphomannomutase/phosphoglucomutase [Thermodesulfovibrionales bacterium]